MSAVPVVKIRPPSGWPAPNFLQLWQFRDLASALAIRDLKLRYRQTALGAVWVILQPIMAAGIFSFVFGTVARMPSDGLPYFVFSFAGLMGWNLFNSTLTKISTSLVGNSHLISKVFFPRLVLPLSSVPSTLVDFAVTSCLMAALIILYKVPVSLNLLFLPVWMALLLLFSVGLGLCAASLTVSYRDVQYMLPVLLQILLYASPVAYSASAMPEHLRVWYHLNPLSELLEAFRWSLLGSGSVDPRHIAIAALWAIGSAVFGLFSFKRMERKFADVI